MIAAMRRLFLFVLGVSLVALLVSPRAAQAHGVLRRSLPAAGAKLDAVPREIRLVFNEPVELAVARIALRAPDGALVPLGSVAHGDSATTVVAAVLGALREGRWTVEWQVAGRDGHPVRGTFAFSVLPGAVGIGAAHPAVASGRGAAANTGAAEAAGAHDAHDASAAATPTPVTTFGAQSPPFAAVRWLGYLGMLALVGAACLALFVLPRARARAPMLAFAEERLSRFGAGAVVLLLVAALLRLAAQMVATQGPGDGSGGVRLTSLLGHTMWGRGWLLQLVGIAAAGAGLALAARARRAGWLLAAAGAVVAAVSLALSGHAASVRDGAPLAIGAHALHVLAAGGWLGTLLAVVIVGIRASLRAEPAERGPAVAALVDAFSPVALACAAVVVATGIVSSWMHLPTLDALWTTTYGRTLLVKLALLSLVLGTGAYNWLRVRPTLGDERSAHRLLRSSTVELVVAACVLAATAVLTATPTAIDAARLAGEP